MMTTEPQESGAAYQYRATGRSLIGLGSLCTLVGIALPFVFDLSDPTNPAIGASGLLFCGVLFVVLGGVMLMSGRETE
jgi:hypothetical protein